MLLSMRSGPGPFQNVFRDRTAHPMIVELFSLVEAVRSPDSLRELLRVSTDQCLRAGQIDFPQQRTRPARQIQAMLHLGGVTAIGGLSSSIAATLRWNVLVMSIGR